MPPKPRRPRKSSKPRPRAPTGASSTDRPFERVWLLVRRIPRGRVATYGQLSDLVGRRLTPIGVGWAIRAAPEDSLPWHRVVNGRGGISTDAEAPGLQRSLLEGEGVRFGKDGRIDLDRHGWKPRER